MGRAPGRGRATRCGCRCCPATAPPGRRPTAPRWPEWYDAVEAAYRELRERCEHGVRAAGCRWAAPWSPGSPSSTGDGIAGLVLVNPAYRHPAARRPVRPLRQLGASSRGRASAATSRSPGVAEPAYDRTPVPAFVSHAAAVEGDRRRPAASSRAPVLMYRTRDDHVVDALSRRSCSRRGRSPPRSREVLLDDSYHVATLDNDAPRIFDRQRGVHRAAHRQPPARSAADGDQRRAARARAIPAPSATTACARQRYVPLTDVDRGDRPAPADRARPGAHRRLPRRRAAGGRPAAGCSSTSDERADARTIVAAAIRGLGIESPTGATEPQRAAARLRAEPRQRAGHRRRVRGAGRRLARRHGRGHPRGRARPDPRGRRVAGPACSRRYPPSRYGSRTSTTCRPRRRRCPASPRRRSSR